MTKKRVVNKIKAWKSSAFTIKLFSQQILIAVGLESSDFGKWFIGQTGDKTTLEVNGRETGRTIFGDGYYAMWTKMGSQRDIAHEATHIAWNLLKDRGIEISEELLSYTIGHIVENYNKELL